MAIMDILSAPATLKEINAVLAAKIIQSTAQYSFTQHLGDRLFSAPLWSEIRDAEEVQIGNFISPDSEAVVKERPNARPMMGEIPMFGIKRMLTGKKFAEVQKLTQGASSDTIAEMYLVDQLANVESFHKLMQYSFQKMASEGWISLSSTIVENFKDITLDYKIPTENFVGVETVGSITYDDIYNIIKDNPMSRAYLTQYEINLLGKNKQMQDQYAMIVGGLPSGASLGLPEINVVFQRFGLVFIELKPFVMDGKNRISAWKEGVISFMPNEKAGIIAHAKTPENEFGRGAGGIQRALDKYSLFSVMDFSQDPFGISNRLETYAVPVLGDGENTFVLDSKVKNV